MECLERLIFLTQCYFSLRACQRFYFNFSKTKPKADFNLEVSGIFEVFDIPFQTHLLSVEDGEDAVDLHLIVTDL